MFPEGQLFLVLTLSAACLFEYAENSSDLVF